MLQPKKLDVFAIKSAQIILNINKESSKALSSSKNRVNFDFPFLKKLKFVGSYLEKAHIREKIFCRIDKAKQPELQVCNFSG